MAATVALAAGPAWAHLEPDPTTAPPGTKVTISFVVEHGCKTSPTVKLEMKLPSGISEVRVPEKAGWQTSIEGGVATWSGGPLPSDQEEPFPLEFVTPREPGDLQFKVVQTCEEGQLDWIQEQQPGGEEPELPIPTLKVEGVAPPTTTGPASATTTTAAPDATTTTDDRATTTELPIAGVGDTTSDSGSNATVVFLAGLGVVAAGMAGFILWRRRSPS